MEEGGRDEGAHCPAQLTVLLLVTLSQLERFSFTSSVALLLLGHLSGTGLVSWSTGDVAGRGHPGSKCTV